MFEDDSQTVVIQGGAAAEEGEVGERLAHREGKRRLA